MKSNRKRPPRMFYTGVEVASMLGVNRLTVYKWCEADIIPSMRLPGVRMYLIPAEWLQGMSLATMQQWAAAQVAADGPEPAGVESGLPTAADAAPLPGEANGDGV